MSARLACVDIGTNTVRLLIAEGEPPSHRDLTRIAVITHLGKDVTAAGRLSPKAVERTLSVLRTFRKEAAAAGALIVAAVATQATRMAANGADFLRAASEALGSEVSLIDGVTEGGLAFAGATSGSGVARSAGLVTLIDVGGGSTEVAVGSVGGSPLVVSMPFGAVTLTESWLRGDPPTADELGRARAEIGAAMAMQLAELRDGAYVAAGTERGDGADVAAGTERGNGVGEPAYAVAGTERGNGVGEPAYAVAGTATALAAVDLELAIYDRDKVHGHRLTSRRLEELLAMLAGMPLAERRMVTGLEPERAPTIVAGALILAEFCRSHGLEGLVVSERDLLDGLLLRAASSG